jgi:serine phosphatase RsbU (regulator of sigma subunit)
MKRLFSILLIISFVPVSGKAGEIDSLLNIYDKAKNDSLKARACFKIGDYYENYDVNTAIKWGEKAIIHAEKFKDDLFMVKTLNYTSTYYFAKGDYHHQIELSLKALRLAEEKEFMEQQGSISSNIAAAYMRLEENELAYDWLIKAIDLKEKYSTPEKQAYSISAMGNYYFNMEEFDKALIYHEKAYNLRKEFKDTLKMAINLGNMADCYLELNQLNKAEKLLLEAYQLRKYYNDHYGIVKSQINLSWLYSMKGEDHTAIKYVDSAYQFSLVAEMSDLHQDATLQLADLYANIKDYHKAYEYQHEAFTGWIALHEEQATYDLNELQTFYQTEKIESQNNLLLKDSEIKDLKIKSDAAEIKNQDFIIWVSSAGLLLSLGFVFLLVKWNKKKKKTNALLREQKSEILIQKEIVEEKNHEILDSIRYAKRIQAAILPPKKLVKEYLNNSFILYKPKDVVAGDFYWMEHKNGKVLFAAADCTGHGVPGAMVSVICNNALNRSVREHGLTDPGKILDKSRKIVIEEFSKSDEEVKDGMDIAICSLEGKTLKYAGAHNPLWIIRNGAREVEEIKANKEPIGKFMEQTPYDTHTIELNTGDTFYLFSDGFADQFGGEKGKKFKTANFKKLLVSVQHESIEQQKNSIDMSFEKWKGELEQLDDVCVIGVRV